MSALIDEEEEEKKKPFLRLRSNVQVTGPMDSATGRFHEPMNPFFSTHPL